MSFIKHCNKGLGALIRRHHMNSAVTTGARFCEAYLSYWWNQKHWDMGKNGEGFLLSALAAQRNMSPRERTTVFDIGANTGEYAKAVRSFMPDCTIHCFEVVPKTREALANKLAGIPDIVISACGLSNEDGYLNIGYNSENDTRAREVTSLTEAREVIACPVQTGDAYRVQHRIETIALVKIDTEGHEIAVLEGFEHTIANARIRAIQFEYGTTWIGSRHFMHEAYALLEPAGYCIGRLYPDGVFFKPYCLLKDEHFRMGNYVAIHETDMPLIVALNLNPTIRLGKPQSHS